MNALLTHPGTQYAPRLASELESHGALGRFVTGLAVTEDRLFGLLEHLAPPSWRPYWDNRRIAGVPSARLHTFPTLELRALWQLRRRKSPEAVFYRRNAAFQRMIPDRWIEEATHVIGFDTSSWLLADRCRAIGRMFVLDQSIGHPRVGECVYSELRNRFPEWSDTIPRKSELHLACEDREHAAAHVIVAPSEFVRKTLLDQGVAEEKIRVIPFGTDLRMFRPAKSPPRPPMVFLYAGALTARKGVPILLAAWKRASLGPRAELWLSGSGHLPPSITKPKGVRLLGKLSRCELADAMRRAHVFVFPSLFEGLAQVQVEALATGLPVIGTISSGAEDLVHPGETGFVLTAGSIDELANCLLQLAANGDMVHTMREKCIASRWLRSWSRYGEQWFDLLSRVCVEAH